MAVDVALDGADALTAPRSRYDVVVLDRDLPGVHGDEVCRRLVAGSARRAGADADRGRHGRRPGRRARPGRRRLPAQAVRLRRAGGPGPGARAGGPARRCRRCSSAATCARPGPARGRHARGRRLDLSPKEFAVLELLLAAGGAVVSAEELLETGVGRGRRPVHTAVKATIRRLRAKLGDPPVIDTVREAGYRIGDRDARARPIVAAPADAALRRAVPRRRARCSSGSAYLLAAARTRARSAARHPRPRVSVAGSRHHPHPRTSRNPR